jgi:hypothetical protein
MEEQQYTELFTYDGRTGRVSRQVVPSVPADFDEFDETAARMRVAIENDPQVKALRAQDSASV